MIALPISRRALLASSATALSCSRPRATGFLGYCLIANRDGKSIGVVDLNKFRARKPIGLDSPPSLVLAHPSQPRALVLAPLAGTIYEIDALRLAVSRRVRVGSQAAAMKVSPAADALWCLYREPPALVEVPLDEFQPRRRIRLTAPPDDFDLSRENRAAIIQRHSRKILIVSLTRSAMERTVVAQDEPSLIQFRYDGTHLLAASRIGRSLTIFDVATGRTVVRLPLSLEPRNFCVTPDGGQLFISGDGMDAVVVVYPYLSEVAETLLAGRAPDGMAATDTTPPYLLVTNPSSDGVTVLNIDTGTLAAAVQVGQEPRHILITPDRQYALVLNEKSGDLAVIRLYSLAARRNKPIPLFTLIPVGERPVSAAVIPL